MLWFQVSNEQLLFYKNNVEEIEENVLEPQNYVTENVLKKYRGTIHDKSKLPIVEVIYGRLSSGSAKITIGPLTCSPG